MPLSGGPSLMLASGPISWQGEHNRLNTCSPAAASCPNVGPVEAATAIPAITHVLSMVHRPNRPIRQATKKALGRRKRPRALGLERVRSLANSSDPRQPAIFGQKKPSVLHRGLEADRSHFFTH